MNGKQKAYVVNQLDLPTANEQELADLDAKATQAQGQVKTSTEKLKSVEGKLKVLTAQPTNAEAQKMIQELTSDVDQLQEKLRTLTDGSRPVISKKEKENIEKSHEKAVKEWRKRKRMCADVMDAILEGYPKTKKVFLEEVGIETDEDAGAKIPEL